jgi:hypothetical protein
LGVLLEDPMIALVDIAALTIATVLALAAATAFQWLGLRLAFRIMQPAAARRISARPGLARGTAQLARAFVVHR